MGTTLLEEPGKGPRKAGTTLMNQGGGGTRLVTPTDTPDAPPSDRSSDPVVGWLVVVSGPGRGSAVELGYGMNIVGRDASNRVSLNFGDDQISGEDHFRITYDQKSRDYHLIPAKGTNLLYVDGKAVLTPMALSPMVDVSVGASVLRFVPLCGAAWDWSVQPAQAT